jgi:type IX secretion system PorP/SprF family membrane protein
MGWVSKISLLAQLSLVSLGIFAQDTQFSQSYSNPLYLNPAFAGTNERSRITLNYRNQWPGLENKYEAFGVGGDYFVRSINGGFGFSVLKDVAGEHRLSNTHGSISYSQHIRLSRKSTLALGVKGGFGERAFDDSNLLFADQVINESNVSESAALLSESHRYGDLSAGVLFFNDNIWLGMSIHHLNSPNQSMKGSVDPIPPKYSIHGGGDIPIKEIKNVERRFRVAFNYKSQGDWDQLDIGGFFTYQQINFGVWYRGLPLKSYLPGYQNNEAIVLLTGYEVMDSWSIGYSYDITISRLTGYTGGAHEIALVYEFPYRLPNKRRRVIPCAKF